MFPFITFVLDFKFKSRLNNFGIRELAKANTIHCVHVFIDEDPFKNSYQKKRKEKNKFATPNSDTFPKYRSKTKKEKKKDTCNKIKSRSLA